MAKYEGSVFGSISGVAVGQIASRWKGIDYFKKYVKPANPKTADQEAQRAKFQTVTKLVSVVNEMLVKPYWTPLPKRKSAYNACVSTNILETVTPTTPFGLVTHIGSMRDPALTVSGGSGGANLVFSWDTTARAGENDDDVIVVGIFSENELELLESFSAKRVDGTISVPGSVITGMTDVNYHYFVLKKDRTSGCRSVAKTYTV